MAKTYTAPTTVSVGDALTASLYNTYVGTNVANLIVPPACRFSLTTARNVPSGSHLSITFNTDAREDYDTDGMLAATAASKITVQTAGIYLCTATVNFSANNTGVRFARIFRNRSGTEIAFAISEVTSTQASVTNASVAGMIECNVADTIELGVFQNSGATLTAAPEAQYGTTFLAVQWIGRTS